MTRNHKRKPHAGKREAFQDNRFSKGLTMDTIPQNTAPRQLLKVNDTESARLHCRQLLETGASNVPLGTLGGFAHVGQELAESVKPVRHDYEQRRQVMEAAARMYPAWKDVILGVSPTPTRRKFEWLTYQDLLLRPRKVWLCHGIIGAGDTAMLYGESGSSKTMIGIDLMHALLKGAVFANAFITPKPIKIMYCAGEGIGGLAARFKEANAKWELTKEQQARLTYVENVPQLFNLDSDYNYENFIDDAQEAGIQVDLIVIDTYHTATAGANENDAGDTGAILAGVNEIKQRLNCAVLLVHHANKNNDLERGSSALKAACDTVVLTKKIGKNDFTLECRKQKDGEQWDTLAFTLRGYGMESLDGAAVGVEWLGQAVDFKPETSATRKDILTAFQELNGQHSEAWYLPKDIVAYAGVTSPSFTKQSKELVEKGLIEKSLLDDTKVFSARTNPYRYRLAPPKISTPQNEDLPIF